MNNKATEPERRDADEPARERTQGTDDVETPSEVAASDETPLERAERERDEHQASSLRAKADYQNLKRRTLADIQAAVRGAQGSVLDDVLLVLDDLDLALATECSGEEAKNLMVGVRMTRDRLATMLAQNGVEPIPAAGEFDPKLHQAVAVVPDEGEPGRILEIVRMGWMMHDVVLRHAHVKVSAAPADEEKGATPA